MAWAAMLLSTAQSRQARTLTRQDMAVFFDE